MPVYNALSVQLMQFTQESEMNNKYKSSINSVLILY